MMTSAQVVETSVNVTSNSPSQDYTHPDDHNLPNYDILSLVNSQDERFLLSPFFRKLFAMGCSASFHHRSSWENMPTNAGFKTVPISLSRKTKIVLRESWKLIEPVKTDAGKAMFVR